MNIRLLIAGFLVFFSVSCRTLNESASYEYVNHSINVISDSISDPEFDRILEPYKSKIQALMSEVIAQSSTGLASYRPESPLSNFLSDLVLHRANLYIASKKPDSQVQFSLYNHGGIRASVPKGAITIENAYEIMPFENEMVLLRLNGKQVQDLADYIATRKGEGVSGISFGMMDNRAVDVKIQGVKLDQEKTYWMVTSNYIANGGDGMKVLTWADQRIDTGILVRDAIIEHLRKMGDRGEDVVADVEGRVYHVN